MPSLIGMPSTSASCRSLLPCGIVLISSARGPHHHVRPGDVREHRLNPAGDVVRPIVDRLGKGVVPQLVDGDRRRDSARSSENRLEQPDDVIAIDVAEDDPLERPPAAAICARRLAQRPP